MVNCIQYMRYMKGEKHLLFFSRRGIFVPQGDRDFDEKLARIANDARVTIDSFQTAGLPYNRSWTQIFALQSIRTISDLTGGRIGIYQDVGKALDRVDEATRTQYLLGYYPEDDRWTGRYRKIEVRVNRPGLVVSYRHGYYAGDTALPYDRADFLAHSRISAAAAYDQAVQDVKFAATATREREGVDRIRIDLGIDPARLGFKVAAGRYTDKLQVAIFYQFRNSKNRYEAGQDWRTMDLNLQESTYRKALQSSSIPCSIVLSQPDIWKIKVVVYDFGADLVGSALVSPAGR